MNTNEELEIIEQIATATISMSSDELTQALTILLFGMMKYHKFDEKLISDLVLNVTRNIGDYNDNKQKELKKAQDHLEVKSSSSDLLERISKDLEN